MPFPKNWSEELVAEWLQLEGYWVETSVPHSATLAGGRHEADVVGVKIQGGALKVRHIEVGDLPEGVAQNVSKITAKRAEQAVTSWARNKLGFQGQTVNYEFLYISTYVAEPTIQAAANQGIVIKKVEDFINVDVRASIQGWKANPPYVTKTKGKLVRLPDSLWMLQLLDRIA